jgi:serine/threonine-protein kinase
MAEDPNSRTSADVTAREGQAAALAVTEAGPTVPPSAPQSPLADLPERLAYHGEIARGGMGAVHRIYDQSLRRYVALKVIDSSAANDPTATRRFLDEAQITGQLDHPNIVPVHELATSEGVPRWFLMKLVEGETLASRLTPDRVAQRTDSELLAHLEVFVKVCEAVAFAHERGVVHRDLKPSNVMIGSHGQVYVMDWGIAQLLPSAPGDSLRDGRVSLGRETNDEPGSVVGTPHYMSPEQALGRPEALDPRADVFALGAVLYQVLTGRPPYVSSDAPGAKSAIEQARFGEVAPPDQVAAKVAIPPAVAELAMRALDRDPARRPASARALKEEVEQCLRGGLWLSRRTFAPGAIVMNEGEPGDFAYIVEQGTCEVIKLVDGQPLRVREMGPGAVFGETAILTDRPRTATVRAIDALTVLVVTRESLARELREPSWLGALVRALAARFREADERLASSSPRDGVPPSRGR